MRIFDEHEINELKEMLREDPGRRKLFVICAKVFHRLPSELEGKNERELNLALAALDLDSEDIGSMQRARMGGV